MDTLIALGIGTTIGIIIWVIRARKVTTQTAYEPAGTVHNGEFHITIGSNHYSAYDQSDGKTVVWVNGEPLGDYSRNDAIFAILDHAEGRQ